jgi:hypothetical protein
MIAACDGVCLGQRTEDKVSLVAKVRDTAGGLYEQAKGKYSDSDTMQRAGKQASQAAAQAGDLATQATGRLKDLAGKTSSAVKSARSKGTPHQ